MSKFVKIMFGVIGVLALVGGLMVAYDRKTASDLDKLFEN